MSVLGFVRLLELFIICSTLYVIGGIFTAIIMKKGVNWASRVSCGMVETIYPAEISMAFCLWPIIWACVLLIVILVLLIIIWEHARIVTNCR